MNIELYAEDSSKKEQGSPCYLDGMGTFYVKRVGSMAQMQEMQELKEHFYGFTDKDIDDAEEHPVQSGHHSAPGQLPQAANKLSDIKELLGVTGSQRPEAKEEDREDGYSGQG